MVDLVLWASWTIVLGLPIPGPGLPSPSLQACLQVYQMSTHKPGPSALGTGSYTFKVHIGLLTSQGPAQNGRNGVKPGLANSTWPGPEPVAAAAGTWGGLVGDG